MGVAREV